MPGFRRRRVACQVRDLVADVIARKLHDPRLRDLHVTDVEMSPDLRLATLYYSVYPAAEARRDAAQVALERASGLLRREIGQRLRLKSTPALRFREDQTADRAAHIERLLAECALDDGDGEQDD